MSYVHDLSGRVLIKIVVTIKALMIKSNGFLRVLPLNVTKCYFKLQIYIVLFVTLCICVM